MTVNRNQNVTTIFSGLIVVKKYVYLNKINRYLEVKFT